MCGIAGIWNFSEKIVPDTLERFTNALKHRGPDGKGFYFDDSENLGLGHYRLAILDLSEYSKQPMSYTNGRYWITYNGEIFNFLELRQELEGYGYQFRSQSDTEIILAAYHKWKEGCLYKFNGMWAFAVWDKEKKELFLSRDRFGIKPLYYLYFPEKIFAFASETIAFNHLDNYLREFDEVNISRVLDNVFSLEGYGQTIFKNIYQILPGHFLTISRAQGLVQKRWWSTFKHLPERPVSYEQQVEEFRKIFHDACILRMRSDVPIATALSGGLDSSAVYCMLHSIMNGRNNESISERIPKNWQKAFVATFLDTQLDESSYASEIIKYTKGSAIYITPDYPNLAEKIIATTKRSDYIYLTPDVSCEIYESMQKANVKVSLDGHGVDEMLLGYSHLVKIAYLTAKENGLHDYMKDLFDTFVNMHMLYSQNEAKLSLLNKGQAGIFRRIYNKYIFNLIKQSNSNWLWQSVANAQIPDFLQEDEELDNLSEIDRALYINFHRTSLPTILRNFDRASMSSGIEVRMPYMDWRLVTYTFSLPLESKIGGGYTKRILRDAMINLMPENIRLRKIKIGLNAPMIEWFSGPLSEYIMDELNSAEFLKSHIWNGPLIRDFVKDKIKNKSWQWNDCVRFWPYLNAHILMK